MALREQKDLILSDADQERVGTADRLAGRSGRARFRLRQKKQDGV